MDRVWDEVPLGELVRIQSGKLDSNRAIKTGRYPFFTCSPETLRIDRYAFDCEAVILAGNNANGIFPVKYFNGRFNARQRTYVITTRDPNELDCRYLYYQIVRAAEYFRDLSIGTTTRFITLGMLQGLEIPVPPIDEQRAIAHVLGILDDKIELNRRMNETLEAMARALFKS